MDLTPGVDFLNKFTKVSQENVDSLLDIAEYKKVSAGTQLVKLNEVPTKLYMVFSGIVRCYLITETGKEFNKTFCMSVGFAASLTALVTKKPSLFVFETLTDCEIFEMDYNKLMKLCESNIVINTLYSRVLESVYASYEKRLVDLISLEAKDRYLALRKQIRNVDELIPQYHIASYLGITPVQLSRIRRKIDSN
jgi:CRP-like cAMP-binding protein